MKNKNTKKTNLKNYSLDNCVTQLADRAEELGDNSLASILYTVAGAVAMGEGGKIRLANYLSPFLQSELELIQELKKL
jgi:hypothetical protein